MSVALVIGKFYPPHNGHLALIHRAARHHRAIVLVMAAREESIALGDRIDWLRASCSALPNVTVVGVVDDAPVDYHSDSAWAAHSAVIAATLRVNHLPNPDVVVSSEGYGPHLAAELRSDCELFDPDRVGVRVSGTAVRADLVGRWELLPVPVRLGLATRVVVVGAESTGTSTLAADLYDHYRAIPGNEAMRRVLEYGREFTYALYDEATDQARRAGQPKPAVEDLTWRPGHFSHIATEQSAREDMAAQAHPLVIADTDAFATTVWERRYLGPGSAAAATAGVPEVSPRRLYLVTDHDGVPFEQDGWRDGESVRTTMHEWFTDELTAGGHPWVLMRGTRDERLAYAIRTVDALWNRTTTFASPEWADRTVLG